MPGRRQRPDLVVVAGSKYPWDRRPGESAKQHAVFMVYAEMDPMTRKYQDAAEVYYRRSGLEIPKHTIATVGGWAREFEWVKRASERDDHFNRIRHREKEKVVKETARKEAVDVEEMRQVLYQQFGEINDNFQTLMTEVLKKPSGISIQGLTALYRLQLDILRHFDADAAESASEKAEREKQRKRHADSLFGSGEETG